MTHFQDMGLPKPLLHALERMQFNTPTPIQAQAIPFALEGRDILGSAQTGTGKTGAFGIPMIAKLLSDPKGAALVVTPTRELATQVHAHLSTMLDKTGPIKTAILIGGEPMFRQLSQLKARPRLIVGTPGRINDHLERRSLKLNQTDFLVLDETDRMLDMGFTIQIENILQYMPQKRQTLLFSATLPANIVRIAQQYLEDPVEVAVSPTSSPAANIKQDTIRVKHADKYPQLLSQLDEREGSVIVFVKTKHGTEKMAHKLIKEGHSADAIHGDLRQNKRSRVIAAFRKKKYRILVATDVAARGLDIPHIEHVINYDLPQCAEDYIHRIGRTARAGAEGSALNLITPEDKSKWSAIDRLLNPNAKPDDSSGPSRKKRGFKQSFGNRRSSQERSFQDRPFHERSSSSRPSRGRPSQDRYSQDRPSHGRTSDRPSQERFFQDRPSQDRYSQDRPSQERFFQDRPPQGRSPGGRPSQGRSASARGAQDRPQGKPSWGGSPTRNEGRFVSKAKPKRKAKAF